MGNAWGNVRTPTRQDQLDALERMGSYLLEPYEPNLLASVVAGEGVAS